MIHCSVRSLDPSGAVTTEAEIGLDLAGGVETRPVAIVGTDPARIASTYASIVLRGGSPLLINPLLSGEARRGLAAHAAAHVDSDDGQVTNQPSSALFPDRGHVLCTSGTTGGGGQPKMYWFPIDRPLANGAAHARSLGLRSDDVVLLPMPITHSFGLVAGLLGCASVGATLLAFAGTPDPATLQKVVERRGVTALYCSPTLARLLVRAFRRREPQTSALRILSVGAGPFGRGEMAELQRFLPAARTFYTYGLTELGPRISTFDAGTAALHPSALDEQPERILPMGTPLPGVTIEVRDGDALWIASPFAAAGRFHDGVLTPLPTPFDTADGARRLAGGDVELLGRRDGTVISGGLNIYPDDVERAAEQVDGVRGACLIGRDSKLYGQVPVLAVDADRDAGPDLAERVRAALQGALPPTHQPVDIRVLPELPRTSLGKIRRGDVRAMLEQEAS